MKKLLLVVSLLGSVIPAPAHAQSVGGYAVEYVEAHANWVAERSTRGSPLFRFVSATRDSEPAERPTTIAQVGKVRCSSRSARRSFFYSCKVSGRLLFLKTKAFEFDGALRSARVVFDARGQSNEIEWTGRDDRLAPVSSLQGGERALVAGASVTAGAKVRGSVLGERFSTQHKKARATLRRGAEAGLIYETGLRGFTARGSSQTDAWRSLRRTVDSL